ncbi:mycothione reductase [Corynebacterium epidermidicanis]|uniref:Mycothione reductase n=1 Tax=Corynebacterium epidermidicanis TaxID=1050174 RepID=A0A0G3GV33_9CORY|nr:mycothione reductase [Corynebacterium epidermidicanis]AKK03393.1 mycothione reductase [Corynebacterium epidermidicanis]
MTKHYDLIIIGTGSGNSIPGPEFDDKSIAIIEEGTFGGTCLNVGCIPTKMYVYAADIARAIDHAHTYGIAAQRTGIDWPSIVDRVFAQRIDLIAQGGEAYRRGPETPNIDVYDHHAVFTGPKTIKTGKGGVECEITGDQIVIAAGSRPMIPQVIADSGVRYYTNNDIMRMPELPASMIIVGGGYIASEFAHVFSGLGVEVTQLNRSQRLLRGQDNDIAARFTEIAARNWNLVLDADVEKLSQDGREITVTTTAGEEYSAEILLVATGRTPNGDLLQLDRAGIEMDGESIKVDEFGRTNVDGVWALGDVSSPYLLKHVANAEMRAVRHNLLHPNDLQKMPHDHVPAAVFTHPQIAAVGLTEQQAREAGYDLTIKIQNYGDVAYGWAMEDKDHFVKLIADRQTGKLLGAHLIGPEAATLIQQLITVMAFDLDCREVATKQYWIHPALPEVIENALLGLDFS